MLAASLFNLLPVLIRFHSPMHWEDHVRSAAAFKHYELPIHYDGSPELMWYIKLPQASLQRAPQADALAKFGQKRAFPYRLVPDSQREQSFGLIANAGALAHSKGWTKSTAGDSASGSTDSNSWVVFRPQPQRKTRTVWLRLRRGEAVALRQQGRIELSIEDVREDKFLPGLPARSDWVILMFDHPELPESFLLKFDEVSRSRLTGLAIALRPHESPHSP